MTTELSYRQKCQRRLIGFMTAHTPEYDAVIKSIVNDDALNSDEVELLIKKFASFTLTDAPVKYLINVIDQEYYVGLRDGCGDLDMSLGGYAWLNNTPDPSILTLPLGGGVDVLDVVWTGDQVDQLAMD